MNGHNNKRDECTSVLVSNISSVILTYANESITLKIKNEPFFNVQLLKQIPDHSRILQNFFQSWLSC